MIQAGLAALGQGRPPLTDLDGGREGRHHGPVGQNPRNQGLRTAHFSGDVPSVHCCHTFICEAPGTAQTHTEHMRKAQSVPGSLWPSPAPTSPRPQVLRPEQALSLPVQLENRCGPAQTPPPLWWGSQAAPRHLSGPRRSHGVQSQRCPSKSGSQTPGFPSCPHRCGWPPPPRGPNQSGPGPLG